MPDAPVLAATGEDAAWRAGAGMPAEFRGTVTIEWPQPFGDGQALQGWQVRVLDDSGAHVTTVCYAKIHVHPAGWAWAELTMLSDPDGNPVPYDQQGKITEVFPLDDGTGRLHQATFPYLITGMSVAPQKLSSGREPWEWPADLEPAARREFFRDLRDAAAEAEQSCDAEPVHKCMREWRGIATAGDPS